MFADAVDVITAIWRPSRLTTSGCPSPVRGQHRRTIDDRPRGGRSRPSPCSRPGRRSSAPWWRRSPRASSRWARDFHPLSANFLLPQWVNTHWPNYVRARSRWGAPTRRTGGSPARSSSPTTHGIASVRPRREPSPYRFYYSQMLKKMRTLGRLEFFKTLSRPARRRDHPRLRPRPAGPSPGRRTRVADQLLGFQEQTGALRRARLRRVRLGRPELARRSMELMAQKVMPEVNAALGAG